MMKCITALLSALAITVAPVAPGGHGKARADVVACQLLVPDNPLTAVGLSTPWRLARCAETDPNNAVFVQAYIFDPTTKALSVYSPLVVTTETLPAVPPTVPILPPGAQVSIWVGANNTVGIGGSSGGFVRIGNQQAFLNVVPWLQTVNAAHPAIPPLGTAADGLPCPSSRDFSIVDQDPSDNTTTKYLDTGHGTAQWTPANRALFPAAKVLFNGSDEATLGRVDTALGCPLWKVADLADPTHTQTVTGGLLQELQAAAHQTAPVALVPGLDPFTLDDGLPNLSRLNRYRAQVDQPPAADTGDDGYCNNILTIGEPRLKADQAWTQPAASPFPSIAANLYDFLAARFSATWDLLHCQTYTGRTVPVMLTYDSAGIVTDAAYQ